MNYKRYINMILLRLSKNYKISLTQISTYKEYKKFNSIKLIIYNYKKGKNKQIQVKTERELLLKLKEMI